LSDTKYFIGTGILSFAFFNWCYFTTKNNTSLSIAAILLYTAPAFVMTFSVILFKEKLTSLKVISLILTFIGCILVTGYFQGSSGKISLIGIITGLGSGLGYALYSIFGNYALKKYDSMTVTFYTFIFASLGLIPVTNFRGITELFSNINVIYYSIGIGIFTTVLPYLLYTKGITHLEISRASIIATIEPVVATIVGVFVFKETVTLYKILGIVLVIIAVAIVRDKE
jgi:drug/metabolite transporter (DMT)-like permease